MKPFMIVVVNLGVLLLSAAQTRGQDLLVPAGTLLQCTMNEPRFSSATASVGDPVLCHLKSFQEFGRTVFPRGSMLAGHLDADKEPGHLKGKGYLNISFDRVILPTGDLPVPSKVIAAKGFRVDKAGDIVGKGHAKRDVAEWIFPPLWPWKVVSLPARGPRPTLKGEEPLELRLMDDIVVPQAVAALYGHTNRPPYASSSVRPNSFSGAQPLQAIQPESIGNKATGPTNQNFVDLAVALSPTDSVKELTMRETALVLKSNQVLLVTKYQMNGGVVTYRALNGTEGSVEVTQVNWRKTTEMTSSVRSADRPMMARATN